MRKCSLFVALALAVPVAMIAQEYRGTISGSVTDPTGAVVAGSKVTVTEIQTGTKVDTVSDNAGQYAAPFLTPGDYSIAVRTPGFKEFVRKGVHLGAGEHPVIDIRLEVGDTATSVEVTADAGVLNTENASAGQSITTKQVDDLPLNGGTPMALASLTLGVIGTGQPGLIHPFDSGGAAGWSVGGGYAQTSELLVDGSPDATWDGRLAYSLPKDAVEEVRVKAFDSDASYGHTGGGTLNQIMKTGTNTVKGTLYEQVQPNTFTSNNFFNNSKGTARPVTHYNQYGVTAGGPMFVPKLFDGRNKLFWFFAFEGLKDSNPNPALTTVPTDAERQGDFSQVLALDKTILYDPYSTATTGSTTTRSAFPNNVIPSNELNPVAKAYLQFYPESNIAAVRPDGYQNFNSTTPTIDDYNNELGRLDYNMSDRSRIFFDIRRTGYSQSKNDYFNNASEGSLLFRNNWGGTVDEVFTVNPTNVLDVRLNVSRMAESHSSPSQGFDPTSLGFPSYIKSNAEYLQIPVIAFASATNFQGMGYSGTGAASNNQLPSQSAQVMGSLNRIMGKHNLKIGMDARQYRLNTYTVGNATGTFSFSANTWVRSAASGASSTTVLGQDFAEFMLGLPTSGSYDLSTYGSWYSYYLAPFIQDDWRIKPNLTISLGVRYDWNGPYHEKWGRTVNGFDFTDANPLQAAAQAAYAKAPIAQIPAGAFNVLGGLTFASPGSNAVYQNASHIVSPRAGFAWTPDALHGRTVLRGGFGVFTSPVTISQLALSGTYSTNPFVNQSGFSATTTLTAPASNSGVPAGTPTLSNPFPGGFTPVVGAGAGLLTANGGAVAFINPQMKTPYSARWNFGIQHSLTTNTVLEVLYIGNHGLHTPVAATQLNGIPRQDLSTSPFLDPAQAYLSTSVTNPFYGLGTATGSSFAAKVNEVQLLARFPEFTVGDTSSGWSGSSGIIEENNSIGSSAFQSLNIGIRRRLSKDLSFNVNFVKSKLTEQDSWLNASDPFLERRVSPSDHPTRFVATVSYNLPFHFKSHLADTLAGGWLINSVFTYQTGAPLLWANGSTTSPGDYLYLGAPLNLSNRQVNGTAFDPTAFDTKSTDVYNYHLRTLPTTFNALRQDGINQFDASILKRFRIDERRLFELRGEFYNLPNHAVFAAPNVTASSSGFGTITATSNLARTVQLVARLYW